MPETSQKEKNKRLANQVRIANRNRFIPIQQEKLGGLRSNRKAFEQFRPHPLAGRLEQRQNSVAGKAAYLTGLQIEGLAGYSIMVILEGLFKAGFQVDYHRLKNDFERAVEQGLDYQPGKTILYETTGPGQFVKVPFSGEPTEALIKANGYVPHPLNLDNPPQQGSAEFDRKFELWKMAGSKAFDRDTTQLYRIDTDGNFERKPIDTSKQAITDRDIENNNLVKEPTIWEGFKLTAESMLSKLAGSSDHRLSEVQPQSQRQGRGSHKGEDDMASIQGAKVKPSSIKLTNSGGN